MEVERGRRATEPRWTQRSGGLWSYIERTRVESLLRLSASSTAWTLKAKRLPLRGRPSSPSSCTSISPFLRAALVVERQVILQIETGGQIDDLADADRLALVAEREAAELRALIKLLDADRLINLDDHVDDGARFDEHRRPLRFLSCLLVDGGGELEDGALLSHGVHVQYRRVAGREDGLVLEEFDDDELRLEAADGGARARPALRQHKARHDVFVRNVLELHARVFAADEVANLVLVEPDIEHLDGRAVWHHPQLVAHADGPLLNLALNDGAQVLVL
mmetsp:Transcript_27953/g.61239  ORF Transcript_27953/g.61239 Transcript_27953/m.61239 type:complete len:278 (+) Transcript_27953:430-1263(+)